MKIASSERFCHSLSAEVAEASFKITHVSAKENCTPLVKH